MTIVEIIVIAGPLTIPNISQTPLSGTIPAKRIRIALTVGGRDSFIPLGRQIKKSTIRKNTVKVYILANSNIKLTLPSLFAYPVRVPPNMSPYGIVCTLDKMGE